MHRLYGSSSRRWGTPTTTRPLAVHQVQSSGVVPPLSSRPVQGFALFKGRDFWQRHLGDPVECDTAFLKIAAGKRDGSFNKSYLSLFPHPHPLPSTFLPLPPPHSSSRALRTPHSSSRLLSSVHALLRANGTARHPSTGMATAAVAAVKAPSQLLVCLCLQEALQTAAAAAAARDGDFSRCWEDAAGQLPPAWRDTARQCIAECGGAIWVAALGPMPLPRDDGRAIGHPDVWTTMTDNMLARLTTPELRRAVRGLRDQALRALLDDDEGWRALPADWTPAAAATLHIAEAGNGEDTGAGGRHFSVTLPADDGRPGPCHGGPGGSACWALPD